MDLGFDFAGLEAVDSSPEPGGGVAGFGLGGNGTRRACLAMMFKLAQSAERGWRLLDGAKLLPDVIQGIVFKDGIRLDQAAA